MCLRGGRASLNGIVAMNVVRMIKFFAWEKRIESQLAEKRNEELACIKRSKLLTIVNVNIKYVCSESDLSMCVSYMCAVQRPHTLGDDGVHLCYLRESIDLQPSSMLIVCYVDIGHEASTDR